jgi:hypothetical protein
MTSAIPIDLLNAFENCIRAAITKDDTALPPASEYALRQEIDRWRSNTASPPSGATLEYDNALARLTAMARDLYEPFRQALTSGRILRPMVTNGAFLTEPVAVAPQGSRELFLIEDYRLTSFLGRYGIGRTVSTLSLLPGEETAISLKTWATTSTTRTDTSSVVDSEDNEVSNKFASTLATEATDTQTQQDASAWNVAASAEAKFIWGSASVSAGASGQSQSDREQFARTATEQVSENARKARSARVTQVTSSTTTSITTGQEDVTERLLRNVNLRRTLNFMFNELNQEYVTRLHMTGVRLAEATPGEQGTWTEYPLSQLSDLLHDAIKSQYYTEVATNVIGAIATVNDHALTPVHPLELLTVNADGSITAMTVTSATQLGPDLLPLPGTRNSLRWRPGPLAGAGSTTQQKDDQFAVDGVLLSEQKIVMPTGSVIVDAALGKHDALDEYAMRAQEAQLRDSENSARRERLLNDALCALKVPAERVRAYAEATFGADGQTPA